MNHEAQAWAFVGWHRKRGGGDFDTDFGAWAASKDFHHRDRVEIRRIAIDMLTGEDAVVNDVMAWFRQAGGAA